MTGAPTPAGRFGGDPRGAAVFALAALTRTALLVATASPPARFRLDVNNYLELALNLFRDGSYGSRVSTDYPPLYPMFIAPAFAIDSNSLRFAAIYGLHGLVLALATLSLFPMLRSAVGARSAWLSLAAAQLLLGATYHAMSTRSEVLFTALLCFATAAVWAAFRSDRARTWALVGFVAGLAIACRRTALVVPVAVGIVVFVEAFATRPLGDGVKTVLRRAVPLGLGLAVGLLPEAIATWIHGGSIETYHRGVVGSHLSPFTRMWATRARMWLAVQTGLRQPIYQLVVFGAAPLVLAATLLSRAQIRRLPRPLAAASGFTLLVGLGLAAMSALHILRYAYGNPEAHPFHLYPRYMDPIETAMVLSAVGVAGALWRLTGDASRREELRTLLVPWILPLGILTWISGAAWRVRGGRFAPRWYFEDTLMHPHYHVLLMLGALGMLVAVLAWWSLGKYGTAWTVVGVVALGWATSMHVVLRPDRFVGEGLPPLPVLLSEPAIASPEAPIAVPVRRRAFNPRELYAPAWRTDHPIFWPQLRELPTWLADHPDGFVITRRWEPDPGHRLGLELVAAEGDWRLWAPRGREVPDLSNLLELDR